MSNEHPVAAGKSSYDLIDSEKFWQLLAISPGITALDLACGAGRYTLPLAKRVGPQGKVIAVDLWADGISQLQNEARRRQMDNLETHVADAGQALPLDDQSVDLCLMATVLHDFVQAGMAADVLREATRVLKPQGVMVMVEFKKEQTPHGPPHAIRLSVEDLAVMVQRLRFIRFSGVVDLGPDLYAVQFRRLGTRSP
jgi:ubiquinone/menaquinone biosynthesis C-methylase UbiE